MNTLNARQKQVLAKLKTQTRSGVALFARVWATPSGSWAETKQAEDQAADALPAGVGFDEALEVVAVAGLVPHFHPDRSRPN